MAFLGGPNQDIKVANAVGGLGLSTDVNGNGDLTDEDNNNTIYSITDQHVPISILESKSISINGTDVDLGGSISLEVATAGDYLSKSGDTLNVNLGTGLEGDGSDNITLTNDSITINGSSVSLGGSTTIDTVGENDIGTTEIDESIAPTWTGKHTFNGGIEFGSLFVGNDPGNAQLANAAITTSPTAGTEQSYSFDINDSSILTVYSEADGSAGTQNEEVRVGGDIKISGGGSLSIGNDPGNSQLANIGVTSTPSAGTEQSYSFDIDDSPILTVYSEANGSGGTQNNEVRVNGDIKTTGELTEGAAL